MAEDEQGGTTGAKGSARRRSAGKSRDSAPKATEAPETDAPETDAPEDAAAEAQPELAAAGEADGEGDAGPVIPPPPPMPESDPEPEANSGEDEPYPKSLLLLRSERLLGVDPSVARGILAEADDPITVADAKARIEAFLTRPVTTHDEEATR